MLFEIVITSDTLTPVWVPLTGRYCTPPDAVFSALRVACPGGVAIDALEGHRIRNVVWVIACGAGTVATSRTQFVEVSRLEIPIVCGPVPGPVSRPDTIT